MADTAPRYIWGVVGPRAPGTSIQAVQPEPLLPADVVRVESGLGITDYTPEGVEEALPRYWPCVDSLVQQKAERIVLEGVPISSQLGRPRVRALLEDTERQTGLTADSTNEAIVAALARLGAGRIAIASRWAEQLNQAMVDYFAAAGIATEAVTSAGQWASEAFSMSVEKGVVLAMRLGREALKRAPQAEALLLPGGTWRSLAVVPLLEDEFDLPVLTNGVATAWRLMDAGIAPPVHGWGRLLAAPVP
jgi:maleate cis-trans isomerase